MGEPAPPSSTSVTIFPPCANWNTSGPLHLLSPLSGALSLGTCLADSLGFSRYSL